MATPILKQLIIEYGSDRHLTKGQLRISSKILLYFDVYILIKSSQNIDYRSWLGMLEESSV